MPRKRKPQPAAEPTPPDSTTQPSAPEVSPPEQPAEGSHVAARRPDGPDIPNPFESRRDSVAGVRLLEDRRYKQMQIRFDAKPSQAVLAVMDVAGYTWRGSEKAWTKQLDPEASWKTRADAERLYAKVARMIREEKGITTELA